MDESMNTNDNQANNTNQVACPDCGANLELEGEVEIGDVIVCDNPECGVELEVVDTNPLEVEYLMVQK